VAAHFWTKDADDVASNVSLSTKTVTTMRPFGGEAAQFSIWKIRRACLIPGSSAMEMVGSTEGAMSPYPSRGKRKRRQTLIPVDRDIVNWFEASGEGWQERLNAVLGNALTPLFHRLASQPSSWNGTNCDGRGFADAITGRGPCSGQLLRSPPS
jgi:hypothetical protein